MITNIQKLLVCASDPVIKAMQIIEQNGAQIALVVSGDCRLLGTLTDGDIRRGLLKGNSLDGNISQFMNVNFRSASVNQDRSKVLEMMRSDAVRQVPVVDESGKVQALYIVDDLLQAPEVDNAIVIMAGGKGKRMQPYTHDCPKPMLTVGGKPMLELILEKCIASGFHDFYFSVNYLKDQIIDYFKDGSEWGVSIHYLEEASPLGTAGSLALLPSSIKKPFLVMNGDVMTHLNPLQLLNYHCEYQANATLCVRDYSINIPFGVVNVEGVNLIDFEEKPTYSHLVNAGIYVIDPVLLSLLQVDSFTDMPSLLQSAKGSGYKIIACPMHENWLDVGNPTSLNIARTQWKQ